jgi:hypothetical protein
MEKSKDDVMTLVAALYKNREAMPMQAEPDEQDVNQEDQDGDT